jgi:hypothetical protein
MTMSESKKDLQALLSHLEVDAPECLDAKGRKRLSGVRLRPDREAERKHERAARYFCFVLPGCSTIRCAEALESIPRPFRLGVLLHEIGHIVLDEFFGDASEVRVDAWAKTVDREYRYALLEGETVQRTGDAFAERLR